MRKVGGCYNEVEEEGWLGIAQDLLPKSTNISEENHLAK